MVNTHFPRLRHFTMLSNHDRDSMLIMVGTDCFELKELLGSRDKFLEVKSYFDGRYSIEEIASLTDVPRNDLEAIVSQFKELGILRHENEKELIETRDFLQKVAESCVMWKKQIGYHRLFSLLQEGKVRKEVFLGWLVETYHYVNSASRHIGTALTHCKDQKWKNLLENYFVDEFNHGELYISSLEKMGIKRAWVMDAHPIIGTMSLINMLCEIGRNSTLGYLACTSLFEASIKDYNLAKLTMEKIAQTFGYDPSVLEGILTHMEQDIKMGHKVLLEEGLENKPYISSEEAHFAVNCLHDLKHSYDQFHDQILQYYCDISNYVPRLKVDYFSL